MSYSVYCGISTLGMHWNKIVISKVRLLKESFLIHLKMEWGVGVELDILGIFIESFFL